MELTFKDDPYKPKNKRGLERKLAKLPGVQAELEVVAQEAAARARATLAEHHHDGHTEIKVKKGNVDRYVILSDERGQSAAAAIEFGTKRSKGIYALARAFGLAQTRRHAGSKRHRKKGRKR